MTNYSKRIAEAGGLDEVMPILKEALREISEDMEKMLNKYQQDMPLLLVCMRQTLPHVERFAGKDGRDLADEICKIVGCIAIRTKE